MGLRRQHHDVGRVVKRLDGLVERESLAERDADCVRSGFQRHAQADAGLLQPVDFVVGVGVEVAADFVGAVVRRVVVKGSAAAGVERQIVAHALIVRGQALVLDRTVLGHGVGGDERLVRADPGRWRGD